MNLHDVCLKRVSFGQVSADWLKYLPLTLHTGSDASYRLRNKVLIISNSSIKRLEGNRGSKRANGLRSVKVFSSTVPPEIFFEKKSNNAEKN